MNVTASVVVYQQTRRELEGVIQSVLSTASIQTLYIIDNSPRDSLRESFTSSKRIVYMHTGANLGYGAGHNIALRAALESRSSYHVVLNPDVSFGAKVVPTLREYAESHSEVGLMMPQVLSQDGEVQRLARLLPTPGSLFMRRFVPISLLQEWWSVRYELQVKERAAALNVPVLSGCFMFLRVSVLREVGLFDEEIFLYMEDVDLSRRIHRKHKTILYPQVYITHAHGRGSYKKLGLLLSHIRSAGYYFNKYGWYIDTERSLLNKRALAALKPNNFV